MENFNKAEESIIPNDHSIRITNFVKKFLSSVCVYLADGECIMNDYELNVYGRPWLKEFLYKVNPLDPQLDANWDNIISSSPTEVNRLPYDDFQSDMAMDNSKNRSLAQGNNNVSSVGINNVSSVALEERNAYTNMAGSIANPTVSGSMISVKIDPATASQLGLVPSSEGLNIPVVDLTSNQINQPAVLQIVDNNSNSHAPSLPGVGTRVHSVQTAGSTNVSPSRKRPLSFCDKQLGPTGGVFYRQFDFVWTFRSS